MPQLHTQENHFEHMCGFEGHIRMNLLYDRNNKHTLLSWHHFQQIKQTEHSQ